MVDEVKTVEFKESRIIGTSLALLVFGFIASFVPDESINVIVMNTAISLISSIIFFVLWRKFKQHSKRYFSLLSYVMMVSFTFYFLVPFFRVFINTPIFWIGLVVLSIIFFMSHRNFEALYIAFKYPRKSKAWKYIFLFSGLVIALGGVVFVYARLSGESIQALPIIVIFYLNACLFMLISPALLISPKRVEELKQKYN